MMRISQRDRRSVHIGRQIQTSWEADDGEEGRLDDVLSKEFNSFDEALDFIFAETEKRNYATIEYQSPENGTMQLKTDQILSDAAFVTYYLDLDNFEPDEIMFIVTEIPSRNFQHHWAK